MNTGLEGFLVREGDSTELGNLKKIIHQFYSGVGERAQSQQTSAFVSSTLNHTSRVAVNLLSLYKELDEEPDENVYAAALCHDIGRMRKKPFWKKQRYWNQTVNENHAKFSEKDCKEYLSKAGYSEIAIAYIASLAGNHDNLNVDKGFGMSYVLLQIADLMDKFSPAAVARLAGNRKSWGWSKNEIIEGVKEVMKKGYEKATRFSVARDYLDHLYQAGKEEFSKYCSGFSQN